jgi:DNA-binding HxlR family transcriptional regulator
MTKTPGKDQHCSIARGVEVLGDRWTALVLREAFFGRTRFGDIREHLGIAPDVLSARLSALVDHGILVRQTYREEGARARDEYVLTEAGTAILPVLGALSGWSRKYNPPLAEPTARYREIATGALAHVAFVTEDGRVLDPAEVELSRGA